MKRRPPSQKKGSGERSKFEADLHAIWDLQRDHNLRQNCQAVIESLVDEYARIKAGEKDGDPSKSASSSSPVKDLETPAPVEESVDVGPVPEAPASAEGPTGLPFTLIVDDTSIPSEGKHVPENCADQLDTSSEQIQVLETSIEAIVEPLVDHPDSKPESGVSIPAIRRETSTVRDEDGYEQGKGNATLQPPPELSPVTTAPSKNINVAFQQIVPPSDASIPELELSADAELRNSEITDTSGRTSSVVSSSSSPSPSSRSDSKTEAAHLEDEVYQVPQPEFSQPAPPPLSTDQPASLTDDLNSHPPSLTGSTIERALGHVDHQSTHQADVQEGPTLSPARSILTSAVIEASGLSTTSAVSARSLFGITPKQRPGPNRDLSDTTSGYRVPRNPTLLPMSTTSLKSTTLPPSGGSVPPWQPSQKTGESSPGPVSNTVLPASAQSRLDQVPRSTGEIILSDDDDDLESFSSRNGNGDDQENVMPPNSSNRENIPIIVDDQEFSITQPTSLRTPNPSAARSSPSKPSRITHNVHDSDSEDDSLDGGHEGRERPFRYPDPRRPPITYANKGKRAKGNIPNSSDLDRQNSDDDTYSNSVTPLAAHTYASTSALKGRDEVSSGTKGPFPNPAKRAREYTTNPGPASTMKIMAQTSLNFSPAFQEAGPPGTSRQQDNGTRPGSTSQDKRIEKGRKPGSNGKRKTDEAWGKGLPKKARNTSEMTSKATHTKSSDKSGNSKGTAIDIEDDTDNESRRKSDIRRRS